MRNYEKEYENEKRTVKRYTVKVPLALSNKLDKKLYKEKITFTELIKRAIDNSLIKEL